MMRRRNHWIARLDSASYHERTEAQAVIEDRGREGLKGLKEALLWRDAAFKDLEG